MEEYRQVDSADIATTTSAVLKKSSRRGFRVQTSWVIQADLKQSHQYPFIATLSGFRPTFTVWQRTPMVDAKRHFNNAAERPVSLSSAAQVRVLILYLSTSGPSTLPGTAI